MQKLPPPVMEAFERVKSEHPGSKLVAAKIRGRYYIYSQKRIWLKEEKRLFEVEPGASFLGYKADAIGAGKKVAEEILIKEYKESMKVDDAISLAVGIIKKLNEKKLTADNIDLSVIKETVGYRMYSSAEIDKFI